jgi:hypothetical protein
MANTITHEPDIPADPHAAEFYSLYFTGCSGRRISPLPSMAEAAKTTAITDPDLARAAALLTVAGFEPVDALLIPGLSPVAASALQAAMRNALLAATQEASSPWTP